MAGLDPAIHDFFAAKKEGKTWITGTSPVMTAAMRQQTGLLRLRSQ
jgi:hypothetical protein